MNNRGWWAVIIVLFLIILFLIWLLLTTHAPQELPILPTATSTPAIATSTSPSATTSMTTPTVTAPASGATVGTTFTVQGVAPNTWFFEAVFPIKVTDANDDTLAAAQAQAQSDWTVEGPVPFIATVTLATTTYHGPATLVLLKDNESGLPQDDDSISIPIVIQ